MLSQSNSAPAAAPPYSQRIQRGEDFWSRIETLLRERQLATTREIAATLGVSLSAALVRLTKLREQGEIRFAAPRGQSKLRTWELGAEEFAERADAMRPVLVKATQLGTVHRDPLVAALFGPAAHRCVSCHRPFSEPHAADCIFTGVNIDAAHHITDTTGA